MSETERYATVVKALAGLLALLGGWLAVAPLVLPGTEDALTHVSVGAVIAAVAAWYLVRVHRDPEAKLASLWFVLVLGVLLLARALFTFTPGTVFYWSTVVTSVLVFLLALVSLFWGSRFGTGSGSKTTIFEK